MYNANDLPLGSFWTIQRPQDMYDRAEYPEQDTDNELVTFLHL